MAIHLRYAGEADLLLLGDIEDAADALFASLPGAGDFGASPTGQHRAGAQGFILVSAESHSGTPVGFAHVVEHNRTEAHLEQLSVLPEHGRRGHGRALVDSAKREARTRGYGRLTLRTFAEVPWNAPFYAGCGFVETQPATVHERELQRAEAQRGLERLGRRVQMTAELAEGPKTRYLT